MIPYLDLHCDTLTDWIDRGQTRDLYDLPDKMLDFKRLQQIGAMGEFFAIFFPPQEENGHALTDEQIFSHSHDLYRQCMKQHSDIIAPAHNLAELEQNHAEGKISAFLSIEDSRAVKGDLRQLEYFYAHDVRCMALTWNFGSMNYPNCFGAPNGPALQHVGLTDFGKEAVAYMQDLGILVDVSHLSDRGFWDVAEHTTKPFIASHSNCRSICGILRNLDDDMIRTLSERGGVAGLNFCPDLTVKGAMECSADDLAVHAAHLLNVGGEECMALGTDFDGIGGQVEIDSPEKMPLLEQALRRQGFTNRQLDKLFTLNAKRVIHDAMK